MALELAAPVPSATPIERRAGRAVQHGPNLFLNNGWLLDSYNNGRTDEIIVDGEWVEDTIKKGEKKGQPVMRLTGDAAEVVRQLREAATELNIGVTIKDYPVLNRNNKEVKGKVLIKYLGINRKAPRGSRSNGATSEAQGTQESLPQE